MDERSLQRLEYPKIIEILTDLARSPLGRAVCTDLKPISDLETVRILQQETTDGVQVLLQKGEPPLAGLHPVRSMIQRCRTGASMSCEQLAQVSSFLGAIQRVHQFAPAADSETAPNLFAERMRALQPCPALEKRLKQAILGPDEVADAASPELARIRRSLRQAQDRVRQILEGMLRKQGEHLQEQWITMRGSRFVLPVKDSHRTAVQGIVHDTSASGQTVFIEPFEVIEANNRIRELESEEREEILRILQVLTDEVMQQADCLLFNAEELAQIDCINAKARLSILQQAQPPHLNAKGRIRLQQARHPLLDPKRAVPISLALGTDFEILLITGPNTGGKTVALKTCGLLTLMAMSGLHVPASESTELSVFDSILVDMGDDQSIAESLSTFSAHMKRLIEMTEAAGPGCLMLADELGSGTDPLEGAALAQTILTEWRERGARVLATTHYRELKLFALETEGVENACCELDAVTFRPTYRILMGAVGTSHAFEISKSLGLDSRLIAQAQGLLSQQDRRMEGILQRLTQTQRQLDEKLESVVQVQEETKQMQSRIAEQERLLQEQKQKWTAKIREEVRSQYADGIREMEQLLQELEGARADWEVEKRRSFSERRRKVGEAFHQVEAEIGASTLEALRAGAGGQDLQVGGQYEASGLGLIGKLISLPDAKGMCKLSTGTLTVQVPQQTLVPASSEREQKPKSLREQSEFYRSRKKERGGSTVTVSGGRGLPLELYLLGQTRADALLALDQHIDQAQVVGVHEIRIVHGKGTGALRQAVHQALKRDARVLEYRLAAYGEGDSGVTIARLKS